jgi:hypothetical protein
MFAVEVFLCRALAWFVLDGDLASNWREPPILLRQVFCSV